MLNVCVYISQHFNGSILEDGDLEFTGIPLDAEHLAVEPKSSNVLNAMPEVLLAGRKCCHHFSGVQDELLLCFVLAHVNTGCPLSHIQVVRITTLCRLLAHSLPRGQLTEMSTGPI